MTEHIKAGTWIQEQHMERAIIPWIPSSSARDACWRRMVAAGNIHPIADARFEVTGVDVSRRLLRWQQKGELQGTQYRIFSADICHLPFPKHVWLVWCYGYLASPVRWAGACYKRIPQTFAQRRQTVPWGFRERRYEVRGIEIESNTFKEKWIIYQLFQCNELKGCSKIFSCRIQSQKRKNDSMKCLHTAMISVEARKWTIDSDPAENIIYRLYMLIEWNRH